MTDLSDTIFAINISAVNGVWAAPAQDLEPEVRP